MSAPDRKQRVYLRMEYLDRMIYLARAWGGILIMGGEHETVSQGAGWVCLDDHVHFRLSHLRRTKSFQSDHPF